MALAASAALFLLIGGMALYQFRLAPDAPGAEGAGAESAGQAAETRAADVASPGGSAGALPSSGATGVAASPGAAGAAPAAGATDAAPSGAAGAPDTTGTAGSPSGAGAEPASGDGPEAVAFSWPLSGRPRVVMAFGAVDGSLGDYRLSDGLALEATPGQPVVAAAPGTVVLVEEHPVDGVTVLLDHGGGRKSRYTGLEEAAVTEGQAVGAGERIGRIGLPAPLRSSLGPHLLFSLLVDDEPVDPLDYLEE